MVNNAEGTYVGTYFEDLPITISCGRKPGIVIDGYKVDGEIITGSELTITPGEWVLQGEVLQLQILFHEEEAESLEIARYHIRGSRDYVVLSNNGNVPVLLSDYALTDTFRDLGKGQLPSLYLEPGEEYTVYGKSYSGEMHPKSIQMTYNWATDEPVLLVHTSGEIVDSRNLRSVQKKENGG